MISPVPDVRPGIVRFYDFPVEAVFGYAVRVIPVEGRGVEKFENHARDKSGIGMRKRLPVLKNIAPVPLVIQDFRAIPLVSDIDRKLVPGA